MCEFTAEYVRGKAVISSFPPLREVEIWNVRDYRLVPAAVKERECPLHFQIT